ncbi:MAG: helix-turn-helix domain-containing protein [Micropruina sp.]|nr:helix-turn-helix transcriptional regulator [Micropruina sp.]
MATFVRQTRKARGFTQAELARRVGVGRDWVVRLEQGNPRLELSKVLDTFAVLGLSLSVSQAVDGDADDPFTQVFEDLR